MSTGVLGALKLIFGFGISGNFLRLKIFVRILENVHLGISLREVLYQPRKLAAPAAFFVVRFAL